MATGPSGAERHPVERLAEEFVARQRRGEHPTMSEYTSRHPAWAAEIRDLFPALLMLERLKDRTGEGSGAEAEDRTPRCPLCQGALAPVDPASTWEIHCPACGATVPNPGATRCEGASDGPGPFEPGAMISHYRLLEKLGAGGMGVVYMAIDTRLGRRVALKLLPARFAADRQALERFRREACTASALNHPHICTVHDIGESESRPFLVMELIEGQTLRALAGQRFAPEEVACLGKQVAEALAVAHAAGIVHRDIKPENLMVRGDGYVKVLDFGLARPFAPGTTTTGAATGATVTEPGTVLGTPRYMAPEQARGEPVGCAADIFALGVVLYELATGHPPFPADAPIHVLQTLLAEPSPLPASRLNPEIPAPLDGLIGRMLETDPRRRPGAAEVGAVLAGLVGECSGTGTGTGAGTGAGAGAGEPAGLSIRPVPRPTVGRDAEAAALRAAFDSAAAGRGRLLCITGEAGIGKTTLVADFLEQLAADGRPCWIAQGRCSERLAGAEAYLPFLEALEGLLRGESGEVVARLLRLVAPTWYVQVAPPATDDASFARALVESRVSSQERMKRELVGFLEEVTRRRPLILFFEDLHWADASTIDLLVYLAGRCAAMRLLVVLTYRTSDFTASAHPFLTVKLELQGRGVCHEIPLDFLGCPEVERYLALAFPGHAFPGNFAAQVHATTAGNPLFLVDLLRYLQDQGVIAEVQGRWALARAVPDLRRELPESVRSLIQKKIDQFTEADRRLLAAASVQGQEFDAAVVARALGQEAAEVEERLGVLDRVHGFVRLIREQEFPDGTLTLRYGFVHVLYQNALYATLGPARRASLSAAVAHALVGYYREHNTAVAAELALLFEAARAKSRAAHYFWRAAQHAGRLFAHQEAIGLARRGLEQLQKLPDTPARLRKELGLHLLIGVALGMHKGWGASEMQRAYGRARELCHRLGEGPELFQVLWGLWVFHQVRGDLGEARTLAEQLLRLAQGAQDPALVVVAHTLMGHTLSHLGELGGAREHIEQGLARYDPRCHETWSAISLVNPVVAGRCQSLGLLWLLGSPDQALEEAREVLSLAQDLAHPLSLAFVHVFVAKVHQLRRDVHRTQEQAEAAIGLSSEYGYADLAELGALWRGWAVAEQGRVEEGIAQMHQALTTLRAMGSEIWRPHGLTLLAEACGKAGQAERGLAAVAEALALTEGGGSRYYEAELHRLRGELLLMRGRGPRVAVGTEAPVEADASVQEEAGACFRRALAVARRQGATALELRAAMSLMRLDRGRGQPDEAFRLLAEIYGRFTEGFDTPDLREARALLEGGS